MSTFTHRHVDDNKTMEITLSPDFSSDDQDELMALVQERAAKGVIFWDLNMTQIPSVNSFLLGLVVALNAMLLSRGGNLRVILQSQSKAASLMHLAQLDKILRFVYV